MNKKSQEGIALIWVILVGTFLITSMGVVHLSRVKRRFEKLEKTQVSYPSPSPEQVSQPKEEKLVGEGEIKEVIAKGEPMKCTYTQEGYTGVSFIKGKKAYNKIGGGGATQYMIIKDNCMWDWYQGDNQGTKMCFGEDIWNSTEAMPAAAEYHCVAATFSDSQFDPPGQINFTNIRRGPPDLLKILPPRERSELKSAINEAQRVLQDVEVFNFTIPTADDIKKSLDQINKQSQEEMQKEIEKQQQQFQPIDIQKIMENLKQNPPAVPHEEKELPPEAQEYYYRKYILKDPAFQW